MRAAVMRNRQIVVDDVPSPSPGPGQVLAGVIACGICGSDLHALRHADKLIASAEASGAPFLMDLDRDIIMGHEFSARVVEVGAGVSNVAPGDIVVSMPVLVTAQGGFAAIGYSNDYPGGYAQQMLLTAPLCLKVPDGLDPRHAALTEPMAVGLHAVVKSGITAGETALVMGCGPVGLATIAALRLEGIDPIVAADFSPARRKLALHMGAHVAVDPREQPAIEASREAGGLKPLVIYEAVGVPGMLDQAMKDAPRNGRILVVGVCMETDAIQPAIGINKELTVQFALGYTPEEFSRTLASIAEGRIDVAPLITGEVGITGVLQAFRDLANPDSHAKILVEPALG
jgi:2-desacetyl-2-hydroxyethyl bacteriochlorophyllide A dehydrogenase